MCSLAYFGSHELDNWSYTGFKFPAGTKRLDTNFFMDKLVGGIPPQNRAALINCFNAFDKGPPRSVIFLMLLNDLRQIHIQQSYPLGSAKPRLNPAAISSSDAADIATTMSAWQSKKAVSIYPQQCHGNPHCFPMDTWIAALLSYPLNVAKYNSKSGNSRTDKKTRNAIRNFVSSAIKLGKVERLLWVAAQARKIHSSICDNALWCIKASTLKARGTNPFTCKACFMPIREACPAYLSISQDTVSFNGSDPEATFRITTSAGNNIAHGQTFLKCATVQGIIDKDTPTDSPESFSAYPSSGHANGAAITVKQFIDLY
jgi:hypothetical protein